MLGRVKGSRAESAAAAPSLTRPPRSGNRSVRTLRLGEQALRFHATEAPLVERPASGPRRRRACRRCVRQRRRATPYTHPGGVMLPTQLASMTSASTRAAEPRGAMGGRVEVAGEKPVGGGAGAAVAPRRPSRDPALALVPRSCRFLRERRAFARSRRQPRSALAHSAITRAARWTSEPPTRSMTPSSVTRPSGVVTTRPSLRTPRKTLVADKSPARPHGSLTRREF